MTVRWVLLVAFAVVDAALGADWSHWRGPNRDGTTPESSRWEEGAWPPGEPAWTASVGAGGSSPLVVGGRIFTLGWRDDADHLECRDAATGDLQWAQSYPAPKWGRHHAGDENQYHGPSSTPEFDAETGYLYTLSIDGDLNCWDTAREGERVWGMNLYDEFGAGRRPDVGGGVRDYGYTTSPLALGQWLIVEVGAPAGNLMAFDKRTGRRLWASGCADPAGHTGGPAPMTVEGIPCVAILTLHRLLVVRLDAGHEGETLAEYPWETQCANSIAGPAVYGDSVVLTSGYSQSRTVRVRVGSDGAELLWEARGRYSKVCTPVIHGERVYFAWQRLHCLDWQSGRPLWEGGRFGDDASMILTADERLIVLGNRRLALCETAARSPDRYTELAAREGVGSAQCWPHVVVADGRILARDRLGTLLCFELGR
ncbi:MAG: PQQ-binding-like beta-propeller repeat protein [Armatimonadota bacterium]